MYRNPWFDIGWNAWMLGAEAWTVIALRGWKLALGGAAAAAEKRRMVDEKVAAGQALQVLAATGGLGFTAPAAARRTIGHYRKRVRANRRRLVKGA